MSAELGGEPPEGLVGDEKLDDRPLFLRVGAEACVGDAGGEFVALFLGAADGDAALFACDGVTFSGEVAVLDPAVGHEPPQEPEKLKGMTASPNSGENLSQAVMPSKVSGFDPFGVV
jgi:hypothetical protein